MFNIELVTEKSYLAVEGTFSCCGSVLLCLAPITLQCWTSLVVQWLRIHLPMQGTGVRALVWKDPTCHRATKPVRHNY